MANLALRFSSINLTIMKSINYSIALRPSNPAEENSPKKAYAVAQYKDVMTLTEFAGHIAEHGSVFDEAVITGVLIKSVKCLRELLLSGMKVRLGDLGNFYVSLQSEGANTAAEFTSSMITGVNVNWEAGVKFQDLITEASFNPVPTRAAAAATLKAEKAGAATVDLAAAKAKANNSGTADDTDGTGGDEPQGSNTGGGLPGGGSEPEEP